MPLLVYTQYTRNNIVWEWLVNLVVNVIRCYPFAFISCVCVRVFFFTLSTWVITRLGKQTHTHTRREKNKHFTTKDETPSVASVI